MVTAKHNTGGILLTEGVPWKGLLRFAIPIPLSLGSTWGLQYIPAIGHTSLFICKPLAWMIVVPFNYWYYFRGTWRKVKIITQ